jgi:hypothetical protein
MPALTRSKALWPQSYAYSALRFSVTVDRSCGDFERIGSWPSLTGQNLTDRLRSQLTPRERGSLSIAKKTNASLSPTDSAIYGKLISDFPL